MYLLHRPLQAWSWRWGTGSWEQEPVIRRTLTKLGNATYRQSAASKDTEMTATGHDPLVALAGKESLCQAQKLFVPHVLVPKECPKLDPRCTRHEAAAA